MQHARQIVKEVYAAKTDMDKADCLIRSYLPCIRSETSKFLLRFCTEQDDEFSIAMIAFHEAIISFSKEKGAFLSYAAMVIRSRLIDYQRKEMRHQGHISLDEEENEEEGSVKDRVVDKRSHVEESADLEAVQQEIKELSAVMEAFGISFRDVADNSPKQERTLESCAVAVRYAAENKHILEELLKTKKLPMAKLVLGSGTERKTLERHRKYILAMLLIQTNGYEILRGHLRQVLKRKEG